MEISILLTLLSIAAILVGAGWRLSQQFSKLKDDIASVKTDTSNHLTETYLPRFDELKENLKELNKKQDMLIKLMYTRPCFKDNSCDDE